MNKAKIAHAVAGSTLILGLGFLAGCNTEPSDTTDQLDVDDSASIVLERPSGKFLFDDFNYENFDAFAANGWSARTETGHPGVENATWSVDGITFHKAGEGAANGMVRMTSYTDGTAANTQHTQFCHARKYFQGTYAARVYFRDAPSVGPDGDQVIQTFYAISPLKAPMDKDYSEMDFEYLPNGGWGEPANALWSTTWETFQLEPWTKVNEFTNVVKSFDGWHTLLMQAVDNKVRYFVDGVMFAEHSENVAPEEPMSINFNLWFTAEGPIDSDEIRQYEEDVDWVYHEVNSVLTTEQVEQKVASLREQKVGFLDTVPAWSPALESPCGL